MRTYEVMRRLDLLPRRRLSVVAVVILAALAAAGGGSVAVAVAGGKYDAAAAGSRPWGSYSYGGGAAVASLAVEDMVAPEFFPVGLVGGEQEEVGYGAIENANQQYCSPKCAERGRSYTGRDCIYKEHCPH